MPDTDIRKIQKKIVLEARKKFEDPAAPRYPFSLEECAGTLFKLLQFENEDPELSEVGQEIMECLSGFFENHKLKNLPDRCEPFAKLILSLVNPPEYRRWREKDAGRAKKSMAFGAVLLALKLLDERSLNANAVEELAGCPRFAQDVGRVYVARNKVHYARGYSMSEQADIFASICVFLLFAVAEYREKLETALQVSDVENPEGLEDIQGSQQSEVVCKRRCKEWKEPLLDKVLPLLAIFEPVSPLELSLVQGFLAQQGVSLPLPQLRETLLRIGHQLQWIDTDRVKLAVKPFAEYVRDKHFSARDLAHKLESAVDWLAKEEEVSAPILSAFLEHWGDSDRVSQKSSILAGKLIELLQAQKKGEILREIFASNSKKPSFPDYAIRALAASAKTGDKKAMGWLGLEKIKGDKLEPDIDEGEKWLRKAARAEDPDAMCFLGYWLILKPDLVEAEQWLRRAVAVQSHYLRAMCFLGYCLILKSDIAEAEQWLRKAAEAQYPKAMRFLGYYLIDGDKLKQDIAEGEQWLRKAAQAEDAEAMGRLGKYLIDGDKLKQDVAEGEQWLRKAAEAQNPKSMAQLGLYLQKRGIPEASEWFDKTASVWLGKAPSVQKSKRMDFDLLSDEWAS